MNAVVGPVAEVPQLDVLSFPLQGSHLIEASAGTGKTWTIAALYLRLVLGHGVPAPRLPADILVLTFTDAAARELRDRIRARLDQAARCFAGEGGLSDPFIAALLDEWPEEQHPACARLLDMAAQSMDEAAISTIHAWCARVLKEHAFDSSCLFEQALQADISAETSQVCWDYWRVFVSPLSRQELALVHECWKGPHDLLVLSAGLSAPELPPVSAASLSEVLSAWQHERAARLSALKQPWLTGADEYRDWLLGLGKNLKGRASSINDWMDKLHAWASDPAADKPDLTKTATQALVPAGLAERWLGEGPAPRHHLSEAFAGLLDELADLPSVSGALLQHAMAWMADSLRQLLDQAAVFSFDSLLQKLDAALDGPRASDLAGILRRQYPVMMIDEFQDTDPLQYRIFERIYQPAVQRDDASLILIGDPKQSIYSFRGADIHTYLRAARDCSGRVHTLTRNFRSSQAMVEAVNTCFSLHESTVFRTCLPDVKIDFHPVQWQGLDESLEIDGTQAVALTAAWVDEDSPGKGLGAVSYRKQAALLCAGNIARLLRLGAAGRAGMRGPGGFRPLQPADLAVLVNTHTEADLLRQALSMSGVRSVYLSENESVYQSPQAAELSLWLGACLDPSDERAVRAALGTPSLGLDLAALYRLTVDERAWDSQIERFHGYRLMGERRGILPMLHRLLHDFQVPSRMLAGGSDGERQLTDILHLAELLHAAGTQLDGMHAVLRHLHEQMQVAKAEDARRLRLESDEGLVRVLTVHKSKGLEFPLVFLPFICESRNVGKNLGPYLLPQEDGRMWLAQATAAQLELLEQERLGEEVRKLYVALTRARHAAWLCLGPLAQVGNRGIGQLLGPGLQESWSRLHARKPLLFAWSEPLQPEPSHGDTSQWPDTALAPARSLSRRVLEDSWWFASYSALCHHGLSAPATAAEDILRESLQQPGELPATMTAADAAPISRLHGLPRGSETGNFLHSLLEWAAHCRFRLPADTRDMIARRCAVRGWEAHIDELHDWLHELMVASLDLGLAGCPPLQFAGLDAIQAEMEFWLPVGRLGIQRLDSLVSRSTFAAAARPGLPDGQMNGMFKGYIDLVFRHEGRYYIMDYKSNDLGPGPASYSDAALAAAMCASRYDVQLIMYIFALHRLLQARLPDYDYDTHMGGGVYFFLRGFEAPGQGLVSLRPEHALMLELDAMFDGREQAHA